MQAFHVVFLLVEKLFVRFVSRERLGRSLEIFISDDAITFSFSFDTQFYNCINYSILKNVHISMKEDSYSKFTMSKAVPVNK